MLKKIIDKLIELGSIFLYALRLSLVLNSKYFIPVGKLLVGFQVFGYGKYQTSSGVHSIT